MGVHGPDSLTCPLGFLLAPVDDEVERSQGAEEPLPQVVLVVGVVHDAGCDERMRDLEEDGRAAAEERHERRVADAADDAIRLEVAVPARKPLSMGALAWNFVTSPTYRHPSRVPEPAPRRVSRFALPRGGRPFSAFS
jgi:hypothetical protein